MGSNEHCKECGRDGERVALVRECPLITTYHCPMRNKAEQVDEAGDWISKPPENANQQMDDLLTKPRDACKIRQPPKPEVDASQFINTNVRDKLEEYIYSLSPVGSVPGSVPGYERLQDVLDRAYDQAARGKGKERHAKDLPFHEQPMQTVTDLSGLGFPLGQAAKKAQEAMRMEPDAAVRELLGAINYLAGAIIWIEGQGKCTNPTAQ